MIPLRDYARKVGVNFEKAMRWFKSGKLGGYVTEDKERMVAEDTPLPEGEEDIPDEELAIKLRELGEPVKLFGENHVNRLRRYWLLIGKDMTPKMSNGPIPTTIPLLPEAEMKVPMAAPKDQVGRKRTFSQLASYFTMVLTEWERAMASRDSEVKESYEGKRAYKAMINAREDLKPLFRKMEKGDLDESILNSIVEIVHAAQRGWRVRAIFSQRQVEGILVHPQRFLRGFPRNCFCQNGHCPQRLRVIWP